MNNIEFIDYDGSYPCLCMGTLKVKINGKEVTFSDSGEYCKYDEEQGKMVYKENCYPTFWASEGRIVNDGNWDLSAEYGDWYVSITTEKYPKEILDIMDDLIKMFNDNVPQGCCGGCI